MREPTEMELRVAKALHDASPFKNEGAYEAESEAYQRLCRLLARAAIRAMLEPTADMIVSGDKQQDAWMDGTAAANTYSAMIDAASPEEA